MNYKSIEKIVFLNLLFCKYLKPIGKNTLSINKIFKHLKSTKCTYLVCMQNWELDYSQTLHDIIVIMM